MQQRMRRLAFFVSAAVLATGGLFAAACGTDNGTTNTPLPTPEAGGRDTGGGGDGGTEEDSSVGVDAGTDADCSRAARLRDEANIYCPFRGDAGPCTPDESCCNPRAVDGTFPKSFCATGKDDNACATQAEGEGSNWSAGGSQWECADGTHCPGAQVCCMFTDPASDQNLNFGPPPGSAGIPKECNALNAYRFGGTRCQDSCAANTEARLCSLNDDHCQGGTTCTPFFALSRDLGTCR
jgi:hypothetical protein